MKYLGIDYGKKRTGLAVSDDSGTLAFPHSVLETRKELAEDISNIVSSEGVQEIILGESNDYAGVPNKIMGNVTRLKTQLESLGHVVHFEKEFLTTKQAEHIQGRAAATDASAAAVLLQSFLDKQRSSIA